MKFIIEQRGETYMVVNDTTGDVRGRHKTKGDAEIHAQSLQKTHDVGIQSVSHRITPPAEIAEE